MSAIMINNINVEFEVTQNEVFATSLQVAEVFGKRHADILRAIEALPQDDFNERNFALVEYTDKKGEARPYYKMTRDGFSMLVMGFTGERAYQWKVEFIKAFNLLLDEVRVLHTQNFIPQDLPTALRAYANEVEQKELALKQRDQALATKAWIGSKREATAMATASAAKREAQKLQIQLDQNEDWATVKKVEFALGGSYDWRKLTATSAELKIERIDVPDKNYGTVKSYHKDVWLKAYGIDITNLDFKKGA